MMDASGPSARIQWMWNASDRPFSKTVPPDWKPYSDVETIIIEEAFQAGQTHAMLDVYSVDLKHRVQILNKDSDKQRPVKRMICGKGDLPAREERFTFTPIDPKHPFGGLYGWISPFIRAAAKHLNLTKENLPSKDKSVVPMVVERAAAGIIEEGKKIGKQCEAEKIATILLKRKNAKIDDVWKCCAYLYSLESFLYKKINETMRLIGDKTYERDWRDKAKTLGPFCLLLWDNPTTDKTIERGTILYRGAKLSDELIAIFMRDCSKKERQVHSFQSFVSCSRLQAQAEQFGNVLFIMNVKHAFSVDLALYSKYPEEEEVLISPGVCFTVDRVYYDKRREKHVIDLFLIQQYRRKLIAHCFCRTIVSTNFP